LEIEKLELEELMFLRFSRIFLIDLCGKLPCHKPNLASNIPVNPDD